MGKMERRWIINDIPLMDGEVAHLGMWWPCSEEDLIVLRAGISVNLALAEYVAFRREARTVS